MVNAINPGTLINPEIQNANCHLSIVLSSLMSLPVVIGAKKPLRLETVLEMAKTMPPYWGANSIMLKDHNQNNRVSIAFIEKINFSPIGGASLVFQATSGAISLSSDEIGIKLTRELFKTKCKKYLFFLDLIQLYFFF